jgi:trehalose 6-phosphate phosphatase
LTGAAPQPSTADGVTGWQRLLAEPRAALVALDFDGTLAPIVDDPAKARAHPLALRVLARLAPLVGQVAIVTGRPAKVAVELGGFAAVEGLEDLVVLGHYGRERWSASSGEVTSPPPPPGLARAAQRLPGVLAAAHAADAYVEDKGSALAVHVRRVPDPRAALARLRGPLTELAAHCGLAVEPGRMVLELRPEGSDKGSALRALAGEVGAATVVFAGDDLGDLTAFDAVADLRSQGLGGLCIFAGSDEVSALAERADLILDGPDGVVAWLSDLVDQLSS